MRPNLPLPLYRYCTSEWRRAWCALFYVDHCTDPQNKSARAWFKKCGWSTWCARSLQVSFLFSCFLLPSFLWCGHVRTFRLYSGSQKRVRSAVALQCGPVYSMAQASSPQKTDLRSRVARKKKKRPPGPRPSGRPSEAARAAFRALPCHETVVFFCLSTLPVYPTRKPFLVGGCLVTKFRSHPPPVIR